MMYCDEFSVLKTKKASNLNISILGIFFSLKAVVYLFFPLKLYS